MRLTKALRSAFVNAALDDVPTEDYRTRIADYAVKATVAMMPEKVREAYLAHPRWFELSGGYVEGVGYLCRPCASDIPLAPEMLKALREMKAAQTEQERRLDDLRTLLTNAAEAATTRAQLAKMLPEFEKYLPAEADKSGRMVPALANVVSAFVQAGWPKDHAGEVTA